MAGNPFRWPNRSGKHSDTAHEAWFNPERPLVPAPQTIRLGRSSPTLERKTTLRELRLPRSGNALSNPLDCSSLLLEKNQKGAQSRTSHKQASATTAWCVPGQADLTERDATEAKEREPRVCEKARRPAAPC